MGCAGTARQVHPRGFLRYSLLAWKYECFIRIICSYMKSYTSVLQDLTVIGSQVCWNGWSTASYRVIEIGILLSMPQFIENDT